MATPTKPKFQSLTPSGVSPFKIGNQTPAPLQPGVAGPLLPGQGRAAGPVKPPAPTFGPVQEGAQGISSITKTPQVGSDFLTDEQRVIIAKATATAGATQPTQGATTFTTPSGAVVNQGGGTVSTPTAPAGAAPTPSAPTAPPIPPETTAAVTAAEKAVEESLRLTPEELATQADIDRLNESLRKAFVNIEDQAIALPFITGQMASVERRALALAEPLERKAARLQAARTSAQVASTFALDRADRAVDVARGERDTARESAKEIRDDVLSIAASALELGASAEQVRAIQTSKTREDALRAAAGTGLFEPSEEGEGGFTLGPGQLRFDSQGNLVASGGAKPASDSAIAKADEKADAEKVARSEKINMISTIGQILKDPNLDAVTGGRLGRTPFKSGSTAEVRNRLKQLDAALSLEGRAKLKGSGTISDFEARMLGDAASILGIDEDGKSQLSNEAMRQALTTINGVLNSSLGNEVKVQVTNPESGEFATGFLGREDIEDAILQGNEVIYL